MALAKVVDSRWVRIWINATAPDTPSGTAEALCAMITKSLEQTKDSTTTIIPDCDDPTNIGSMTRAMVSKDWRITGTLLYEQASRSKLQALMNATTSSNMVFEIVDPDGALDGYYAGKAFMTQFNINAPQDEFVQDDVIFEADGLIAWTTAAAAMAFAKPGVDFAQYSSPIRKRLAAIAAMKAQTAQAA